jgi:hypothetical protein
MAAFFRPTKSWIPLSLPMIHYYKAMMSLDESASVVSHDLLLGSDAVALVSESYLAFLHICRLGCRWL